MEKITYIVRGAINPKMILCTDGEFHVESLIGPGGWSAKVYKTEAGAKRHNPGCSTQKVTDGVIR
jgi:hypothetical protein